MATCDYCGEYVDNLGHTSKTRHYRCATKHIEKLEAEVERLTEFVSWVITWGEQDHMPQAIVERAEELVE